MLRYLTMTMKALLILTTLSSVALASSILQLPPPFRHTFSNPPVHDESYKIPTVSESVAMARKIMHLTTIGDLVSSFPEPAQGSDIVELENRPRDIAGSPIGLMEYYADCDPLSGNPILLAIDIATPYKNYNQGSNISLAIRWWPTQKNTYSFWANEDEEIPTPRTPAALPRFSLHGRLETLSEEKLKDGKIRECFLRAHPDSIYWQPGNDISHSSQYVQLIVDHVYWFGGFGDRARIGWLPIEEWRNKTMEEIIKAKLPGEKKAKSLWKQWL